MTAGSFSNQSAPDPDVSGQTCGLYLHIPFCVRKCFYCSFFSLPGRSDLHARYCRAMREHVQQTAREDGMANFLIPTVFFGGGTPSTLPVAQLAEILAACRDSLRLSHDNPEISLEMNPATVNRDVLERLLAAGFNRLSIGAQSFADKDLQALGRPHTAAESRQVFRMARQAGFANISLDLMYGLPGQTVSAWKRTLLTALELAPDHLSIYELSIEKDTVFADLLHQVRLQLPDEDQVLLMMTAALEETEKKGLLRYEISNYARPGKECRHNINYWRNGSYIGIGAGAVSCISGRRFSVIADVEEYCRRIEAGESVIAEIEELDNEARFRESVVMGLRMTSGVSIAGLEEIFGINAEEYYGELLARLQHDELLIREGGFMKLTARGFRLANRVMAELV
ncbi:MAG: radical SAM family heme chaperone HemW [Desulfobulbaceae bacterium]|nr:radical SAM family heme chaperone HemW [Desulfobulbaceae bacterium]